MADQPSRFRKSFRLINRLGVSSLLLGIGAGLIKAWAMFYLGPGSLAPQSAADSPPPAVAAVDVSQTRPSTVEDLLAGSPVTLADWQTKVEQRYETASQRERAFRNYLGKEVIWEGYFDQFHEVAEPRDAEHACTLIVHESRATLFEKRLLGPPTVRCWLPVTAVDSLKTLQRGDWIVVRGRLNDAMLAGSVLCTDLDQTTLVISSSNRAVETALSQETPLLR